MDEPKKSAEDPLPTRGSMLLRLSDSGDEVTWADFYQRYRPLVYGFAIKLALTHEEAEEVCQDVFAEVSDKIGEFQKDPGRGAFRSWLFQRTEWRVKDKYRKRRRELPGVAPLPEEGSSTAEPSQIPVPADLEELWETEWAKNRLDAALQKLARKVSAKKYQAFELHALREWPASQVAKSLNMSIPAVYVNTHRLRKLLKRDMEGPGE